jgi:NAD(P)-dependent dehydrogenase (short-subunit alcohol dehydrogenase family)
MPALKGRVAIITGAATGIGLAAAERLGRDGASVIVADIEGHEAAAQQLTAKAIDAIAIRTDVTSQQDVSGLTKSVIERYGRIDILVNNAAFTRPRRGPFEEIPLEDWRRMFEVNVIGVVNMCKAVSPHIRASKCGRIVNLTSGTAFKGSPGILHYIASKGAIISMTRSLANEFSSDNVTVNAVSPGFTLTQKMAESDMRDTLSEAAIQTRLLKRQALPDDVANVICFLAGDDSSFITGQIIAADGGSVFH